MRTQQELSRFTRWLDAHIGRAVLLSAFVGLLLAFGFLSLLGATCSGAAWTPLKELFIETWVEQVGAKWWYPQVCQESARSLWTAVSAISAAPALTLTWYWRTWHQNQNLEHARQSHRLAAMAQFNERYARAVELLGSSERTPRLGAIYALQQLAKDSQESHLAPVISTLTTFVRGWKRDPLIQLRPPVTDSAPLSDKERSQQREIRLKKYKEDMKWRFRNERPPAGYEGMHCDLHEETPSDVRAAIVVIGSLTAGIENIEIDFRRTNLTNVDFSTVDLSRVRFDGSDVAGADFTGATLRNASFRDAAACGTNFFRCNLTDTDLTSASLEFANFRRANLERVSFDHTDCTGAVFDGARTEGATAIGAEFGDTTGLSDSQWESMQESRPKKSNE